VTTKKCPYCGQLLDNVAFKCSRCKKWVEDNEVFNRLCEADIKIIKNNDLTPYTPSLIAVMVLELLKEDDYVKESLQKPEWETLNEEQQFNLLVFESFCYFETICSFVRMKQGCRDKITQMLKVTLLNGVTRLFNDRVEHTFSLDVLEKRGEILYTKLQAILKRIPWEASPPSQLEASNAFGSVVFVEDSPLSFKGLDLYLRLWTTFGNMGRVFSKNVSR
jgi:hypothetical protein